MSLIAVLIGFGHLSDYVQVKGKNTENEGITMTSFNVRNFMGGFTTEKSHVDEKVYQFLKEKNPDIICLQEASLGRLRKHYKAEGKGAKDISFLNYIHNSTNGGPITFSRYPIIGKEQINFKDSGNKTIISDIVINSDTVRLFNTHLQSYKFTDQDISSLDSISFNLQEENYKVMRYTGSKLKRAFIQRTEQAEILAGLIQKSPYKVLVCGDFNDTPLSYSYHTVKKGLKDAFVESGSGIGNTYLGDLPSLRIDYILHSPEFESFNFEVDKVQLSDHFPISCTLIPKSEEVETDD